MDEWSWRVWQKMGEQTVTGFNVEFDAALKELRDGWFHPDYMAPKARPRTRHLL